MNATKDQIEESVARAIYDADRAAADTSFDEHKGDWTDMARAAIAAHTAALDLARNEVQPASMVDVVAKAVVTDLTAHDKGPDWDEMADVDRNHARTVANSIVTTLAAEGYVIVPRAENGRIKRALQDIDVIEPGAWSYLLDAAIFSPKDTP